MYNSPGLCHIQQSVLFESFLVDQMENGESVLVTRSSTHNQPFRNLDLSFLVPTFRIQTVNDSTRTRSVDRRHPELEDFLLLLL